MWGWLFTLPWHGLLVLLGAFMTLLAFTIWSVHTVKQAIQIVTAIVQQEQVRRFRQILRTQAMILRKLENLSEQVNDREKQSNND